MRPYAYFMLVPLLLTLTGISLPAGASGQPQANVLNADFMAIGPGNTSSTVLVGGTDGRLLRSADGGKTWQQTAIDSKYQIVQISARPQGAVLAIAQEGLLRSTDDGQHWDLLELPEGQRISRLAFYPKTGQWIGVSMGGAILGSRSDGEHWQILYQTKDSAPLTALTSDNGYLVAAGAGGQVVFSADGQHWKPLATDTTAPITRLLPLPGKAGVLSFWADSSVIAVPANGSTPIRRSSASQDVPYAVAYDSLHHLTLMATTKGHLHRSGNAGKSWQDLGSLDNILLTTLLADAKDGSLTAIGARGTVARSTDGGKNWNIVMGNQWGATLNTAAASPDGQHLLAAGTGGLLMASDDRGRHWNTLAANIKYYVQDLLPTPDHKAVLAIGEQGLVLRSTDSGQTWMRIATGMKPDVTLFSVIEHPRTHELLACGPMGTFLASPDGGLSWRITRPVEEAGEGYLKQLVADPASGTLLAVASPGTVIRSDDAGSSWQATDADTSDKGIVTAAALGKGVFIATQGDGRILRSTDDGRHWANTDITGASPGNLYAEPVSGLAWIMVRDALYRSRDHGITWQRSEIQGTTLNFLLRTPSGTLLGFGNAGAIIRSTDDGEHWASVASGTLSSLRKPLADAAYGRIFVPGRDGTLLVSADDGLHWQGIETNTPAHLNRLWLSQDGKNLIVSGERIVHISLP
jgi:photosystem II stability/assembly factor-like uncharacterized protein